MTQQQLATAVSVTRGYIANIERGRGNPSLALVDRIALALELEIEPVARSPVIIRADRQRDLVHARCSVYVDRRLRSAGWLTAREVEITQGRSHGWIDLLAFGPKTGTLLVIEIKTRLDDLGAVERQLGWYERSSFTLARRSGWHATRTIGWLLASDEVEAALRSNRELMAQAFPNRAGTMAEILGAPDLGAAAGRGLAPIDPTTKRRAWLALSQLDGRRSRAPFTDYGDATRRLAT
jgi:transcriptional regulator with XRE-family HTH domain